MRYALDITHNGKAAYRMAKSRIHIKKSNRGKLRKSTGTAKGKNIPVNELRRRAKSSNPTTRKRAQFALNARKWNKGKRKSR